jgi:predicted  nucleic acid-binding Zn-ribbon protein
MKSFSKIYCYVPITYDWVFYLKIFNSNPERVKIRKELKIMKSTLNKKKRKIKEIEKEIQNIRGYT